MPYPPLLAVPLVMALKLLAVPSTSVEVKLPVTVAILTMLSLVPPDSVTEPSLVPANTAASLLPVIVNLALTVPVPAAAALSIT